MKAAVLVLLLASGPAYAGTLSDAAVIAAAGVDLYSTRIAIQRGGQEINTVSSMKGQLALHAAVVGASLLLAHQAERDGRKGWARAARLVPVVLFGGAAAWNFARGGRR